MTMGGEAIAGADASLLFEGASAFDAEAEGAFPKVLLTQR